MVVWYPARTTTTAPKLIADNPAFVGVMSVENAPPAEGEHPLVVLSHGYRGNWTNQACLASALAHQGYIVAAVNHPGSTTHDSSPQEAAQLWQRPADIGRAIDAVRLSRKIWRCREAAYCRSVIHWRLGQQWKSPARVSTRPICPRVQRSSEVSQLRRLPNNESAAHGIKGPTGRRLRETRVTAVVALDWVCPRLHGCSLAALPVPVLVIAAGVPSEDLPAELESADLAKRLPKTSSQYVEIGDASHFSFLSLCKPGAMAMLEEDVPGDGIICTDGESGRAREVIQQQVISLISEFLQVSQETPN